MILANDGVDQRCRRKLESSGDVVVENKLSHEELQGGLAKEFDCIIVRSATNLTKEVIQANTGNGSQLKLLIRAGVGLDNIDTTFAESVGLIVRNTPNASTKEHLENSKTSMDHSVESVPKGADPDRSWCEVVAHH